MNLFLLSHPGSWFKKKKYCSIPLYLHNPAPLKGRGVTEWSQNLHAVTFRDSSVIQKNRQTWTHLTSTAAMLIRKHGIPLLRSSPDAELTSYVFKSLSCALIIEERMMENVIIIITGVQYFCMHIKIKAKNDSLLCIFVSHVLCIMQCFKLKK